MEDTIKEQCYAKMASYKEDDFTKEILKPLFEAMGYSRVEFNGGPYERGRDLIASSVGLPPKREEYVVYVQSKKLNNSGKLNANEFSRLAHQLRQAAQKGFTRLDGSVVKAKHLYIAVPTKISQRFLDELKDELYGDDKLKLEPLDCVAILDLISEYCPALLRKLESFESKLWAKEDAKNTNRELLGALCAKRENIDLRDFYSDLAFFIGNVSTRYLLTTKITERESNVLSLNETEWNSLLKERIFFEKYTGVDILTESPSEVYACYEKELDYANSEHNKALIRDFSEIDSSAKQKFKGYSEDLERVINRIDIESKNMQRERSVRREISDVKDFFEGIFSELSYGRVNDKFSKRLEFKSFGEDVDSFIQKALSCSSDWYEELVISRERLKELEEAIIRIPKLRVRLDTRSLVDEFHRRQENYKKGILELNKPDERKITKVRQWLDEFESSLKLLEQVCTDESIVKKALIFEHNKKNIDDERVTISPHDVFYTGKNIAVYGGPGVGKTTTLEIFSDEYTESINGRKLIFCSLNRVVVSLRNVIKYKAIKEIPSQGEIDSVLKETIGKIVLCSRGVDINERHIHELEKYLQDGFVLVLDGLDEIVSEFPIVLDAMARVKKLYPNIQWIVSSRDCVGYLSKIDFLGITLLPFTNSQLEKFISGWFEGSKKGTDLFKKLSQKGFIDNVRTPLLATILCSLVEKGVNVPKKETEIYAARLALLLGRYDDFKEVKRQKNERETLHIIAKKLASFMHTKHQRTIGEREALEALVKECNSTYTRRFLAQCIIELQNPCSVLVKDPQTRLLSFGHFRFQEHLASEELCSNRSISLLEIINEDWWRGALSLYSQSVGNIDDLIDELLEKSGRISNTVDQTLREMSSHLLPEQRSNVNSLLNMYRQSDFVEVDEWWHSSL